MDEVVDRAMAERGTAAYEYVLRVATEATLAAGAVLRADFLRPHGPRGAGEHADADDEAEAIIRARLLDATPQWSYRGEETGYRAGSEGHHVWLVDPNDGTAAYLKGFRGSAVSIGLLRDAVPVLGVVYAFAAPDNEGDLFAWAEGCGPLRRNGRPVERRAWTEDITPETIALVSQSADEAPLVNLQLLAPGRYATCTSIAYRLALLAAGEGDIAVCLGAPGDWDYAGGHALLRSCGGALVDEAGRPVTYTRDGRSRTTLCFGGSPATAPLVAGRGWSRAMDAKLPSSASPYRLSRPVPGETIPENAVLDRALGCWLGQLCGDALGSMVEFQPAQRLVARYPGGLREIGPSPVWGTPAGQPTDDSELALMLARTLLDAGRYDVQDVARAYAHWYQSEPFDMGDSTRQALDAMCRALDAGGDPVEAAERSANHESQANGALMRQSPLAIWGHAVPPEELDGYAREDTRLTHPNRVCQDASAVFIVALAAAVREGLDGEAAYAVAREWDRSRGRSPAVTHALEAARHSPPDTEQKSGWVLVALQNAFYKALHAPSLEEAMVGTVMAGGDTDTNGAIVGALLGAVRGARAVPPQWRMAVSSCRPQKAVPGVQRPRPSAFWPVDWGLAERLAVAGRRNTLS